MREIRRIDSKLNKGWNNYLIQAQQRTWKEYGAILQIEEVLWYQKSHAKWIEFGDRITEYFHGVTTIRRRKNSIKTLQNDGGDWISELAALEEMATNYFKGHFTEDNHRSTSFLTGHFPMVDEEFF